VRGIAFSQYIKKYVTNDWGDTDAFSFLWDSSAYNDVSRPIRNYSCAKPNPFFCDPEIMELIDASYREMDPTKRERLLQDILAELREQAPAIFIVTTTLGFGVSNRIDDFVVRPHGIMYERISFSDK
jgi:ABC-type transport system substrate-binding protein